MQNKRRVGRKYEEQVAQYLRRQGYEILEQNFYTRFGEIDIVCRKDGVYVFVEVKYRGSEKFGTPTRAVDFRKRQKISNAASYYLYRRFLPMDTPCRFDVAAVSEHTIQMIENAFEYAGNFNI